MKTALQTNIIKSSKPPFHVEFIAGLLSFLTYGIDKAILLGFMVYSAVIIKNGIRKEDVILIVTTILLFLAVLAELLV